MKINILVATFCLFMSSLTGQVVTQTYRVNGDCEMCKKTIELACYSVKGVKKAVWNTDSLQLTVTFDSLKTNRTVILQRVAQKGYDTELIKADDKTYNNLTKCCQYDRKRITIIEKQ